MLQPRSNPASGRVEPPTAYSRFPSAARNAWLEGLQQKIQKALHPETSPGPSRSPSPFEVVPAILIVHDAGGEYEEDELFDGEEHSEDRKDEGELTEPELGFGSVAHAKAIAMDPAEVLDEVLQGGEAVYTTGQDDDEYDDEQGEPLKGADEEGEDTERSYDEDEEGELEDEGVQYIGSSDEDRPPPLQPSTRHVNGDEVDEEDDEDLGVYDYGYDMERTSSPIPGASQLEDDEEYGEDGDESDATQVAEASSDGDRATDEEEDVADPLLARTPIADPNEDLYQSQSMYPELDHLRNQSGALLQFTSFASPLIQHPAIHELSNDLIDPALLHDIAQHVDQMMTPPELDDYDISAQPVIPLETVPEDASRITEDVVVNSEARVDPGRFEDNENFREVTGATEGDNASPSPTYPIQMDLLNLSTPQDPLGLEMSPESALISDQDGRVDDVIEVFSSDDDDLSSSEGEKGERADTEETENEEDSAEEEYHEEEETVEEPQGSTGRLSFRSPYTPGDIIEIDSGSDTTMLDDEAEDREVDDVHEAPAEYNDEGSYASERTPEPVQSDGLGYIDMPLAPEPNPADGIFLNVTETAGVNAAAAEETRISDLPDIVDDEVFQIPSSELSIPEAAVATEYSRPTEESLLSDLVAVREVPVHVGSVTAIETVNEQLILTMEDDGGQSLTNEIVIAEASASRHSPSISDSVIRGTVTMEEVPLDAAPVATLEGHIKETVEMPVGDDGEGAHSNNMFMAEMHGSLEISPAEDQSADHVEPAFSEQLVTDANARLSPAGVQQSVEMGDLIGTHLDQSPSVDTLAPPSFTSVAPEVLADPGDLNMDHVPVISEAHVVPAEDRAVIAETEQVRHTSVESSTPDQLSTSVYPHPESYSLRSDDRPSDDIEPAPVERPVRLAVRDEMQVDFDESSLGSSSPARPAADLDTNQTNISIELRHAKQSETRTSDRGEDPIAALELNEPELLVTDPSATGPTALALEIMESAGQLPTSSERGEQIGDAALPAGSADLPDPHLAPPDTTMPTPFLMQEHRGDRSIAPSLIVEPPTHPPNASMVSVPQSRKDSPIDLPDPYIAPPDSTLPGRLKSEDLEPNESPTPSLVVEPPYPPPTVDSVVRHTFRAPSPPILPDPYSAPADSKVSAPSLPLQSNAQTPTPSLIVEPATDTFTFDKSIPLSTSRSPPRTSGPFLPSLGSDGPTLGVPIDTHSLLTPDHIEAQPSDEEKGEPQTSVETPSPSIRAAADNPDIPDRSLPPVHDMLNQESNGGQAQPEEPVESRLRHHHGSGEVQSVKRQTRSQDRHSASPVPAPPVTRSHCFYRKLRVSDDDLTAVVLVPQCTLADAARLHESEWEDAGEPSAEEEQEARPRPMTDLAPLLHPSLTVKVHRIVGKNIFDEGHCFLLYAESSALAPAGDRSSRKATPRNSQKRKVESDLFNDNDAVNHKQSTPGPIPSRNVRGAKRRISATPQTAVITRSQRRSLVRSMSRTTSLATDDAEDREQTPTPSVPMPSTSATNSAKKRRKPRPTGSSMGTRDFEEAEGSETRREVTPVARASSTKGITPQRTAASEEHGDSELEEEHTEEERSLIDAASKKNGKALESTSTRSNLDVELELPTEREETPFSTIEAAPNLGSTSQHEARKSQKATDIEGKDEDEEWDVTSQTPTPVSVKKVTRSRASEARETTPVKAAEVSPEQTSPPAQSTRKRKFCLSHPDVRDDTSGRDIENSGADHEQAAGSPLIRETRSMKRRAIAAPAAPHVPLAEGGDEDIDGDVQIETLTTETPRLGRKGILGKMLGWGRGR